MWMWPAGQVYVMVVGSAANVRDLAGVAVHPLEHPLAVPLRSCGDPAVSADPEACIDEGKYLKLNQVLDEYEVTRRQVSAGIEQTSPSGLLPNQGM